MLEYRISSGDKISFEPSTVVCVLGDGGDRALITLTNGKEFVVQQRYEQVLQDIGFRSPNPTPEPETIELQDFAERLQRRLAYKARSYYKLKFVDANERDPYFFPNYIGRTEGLNEAIEDVHTILRDFREDQQ